MIEISDRDFSVVLHEHFSHEYGQSVTQGTMLVSGRGMGGITQLPDLYKQIAVGETVLYKGRQWDVRHAAIACASDPDQRTNIYSLEIDCVEVPEWNS